MFSSVISGRDEFDSIEVGNTQYVSVLPESVADIREWPSSETPEKDYKLLIALSMLKIFIP